MNSVSLVVPISPVAAPRMTRRDKWASRPCVTRYRAFKDQLRLSVNQQTKRSQLDNAYHVSWTAYFPFPKSYSKNKRAQLTGQLHQQKPDRDNIDKAILDALFPADEQIAQGTTEKRWDDGLGPRIVLTIEYTTT